MGYNLHFEMRNEEILRNLVVVQTYLGTIQHLFSQQLDQ